MFIPPSSEDGRFVEGEILSPLLHGREETLPRGPRPFIKRRTPLSLPFEVLRPYRG